MAIGEVVGGVPYQTRHNHVYQQRGPAKSHKCSHCSEQAFDWAQITGTDGLSPDDYMPLCRKCHQVYDGVHANRRMHGPKRPAKPKPHHEGHHQAKLTLADARRIRALYFREEVTHQILADDYEVTKRNVTVILNNIGWKDDGSE